MNNLSKFLLFILSVGALGAVGYFVLHKTNAQLKKEILQNAAIDNQADYLHLNSILNRMTRQELLDMHRFMSMHITEANANKMKSKIDPALKQRLIAISNKYNIFT